MSENQNPKDEKKEGQDAATAEAKSAKAARGEEIPEWCKPEYSGRLTATQALQRNKHLAAAEAAKKTKAAPKGETK